MYVQCAMQRGWQYVVSTSYYLLGIILSAGSQQSPDILDNIIMNIWQPEERQSNTKQLCGHKSVNLIRRWLAAGGASQLMI